MKKHVLICILSICVAFGAVAQVNYQWVKSMGGYNPDKGSSVATDASGNTYVSSLLSLSSQSSADFDPYGAGSGSFSFIPNSSGNCVIAKYDADGNCMWTNNFTGSGINDLSFIVSSIAVSADGSYLYVSGGFIGTANFSGTTFTSGSDFMPFLAQYNTSDGTLVWVNNLGLTDMVVTDIAPHPGGSYVCLVASAGEGLEAIYGKCDDSNGNILYVDTIKGAAGSGIVPYGVALDVNSNITITGSYTGTIDFDPSLSPELRISAGMADIFIAQYTLNGDYVWANTYGGIFNDIGKSIAFSSTGDSLYVSGVFQNGADFGQGVISVTGVNSGFIAKFDNSNYGSLLGFNQIKTLNASDSIVCSAIAVDAQDNVYITGAFQGKASFSDNTSNDTIESNGGSDIFFAKYTASLGYGWSRNIGRDYADAAMDIAISNENIYITGYFNDTVDFNAGAGIAKRAVSKDPQSTSLFADIFILKYGLGSATIRGTVYYKNANNITDSLTSNSIGKKVRLYTQILFDGNSALNLVSETDVDNMGKYEFTNVPDGDYLAFAVPGAYYVSTENLIPSYYTDDINNDTAFQWQAAGIISAQSTAPAFVANIYLVKGIPLTGTVKLGGTIMAEDAFFREVKPVVGGSVVIRKNPGHALVTSTETDEFGRYSFSNLQAVTGDTCYRLYVNIAGLPMVSNYSPRPGQGDSIMNLNFVVDSVTIDTVASIVNSVSQKKTLNAELTVYPNPNNGFVTLEFAIASPQFVTIEVYDLLGKKVASLLNEHKQAGQVQYKYNASDKGIKAGVYFLNVSIGNEKITRKIVQLN